MGHLVLSLSRSTRAGYWYGSVLLCRICPRPSALPKRCRVETTTPLNPTSHRRRAKSQRGGSNLAASASQARRRTNAPRIFPCLRIVATNATADQNVSPAIKSVAAPPPSLVVFVGSRVAVDIAAALHR